MALHELLDTVPQSRDGIHILVQTQHKTVFLVVLLHEAERIKVHVSKDLNARLHTPIVLELLHQLVTEEEP